MGATHVTDVSDLTTLRAVPTSGRPAWANCDRRLTRSETFLGRNRTNTHETLTLDQGFHPIGGTAGRSPAQLSPIPQTLPRICTVTGYITVPGSRGIQEFHRPCCATLTPCQLRVVRRERRVS